MITANDLLTAARRYLETPFHHRARILGRGMDCVGLVLSVGEDLGLSDRNGKPFRREDYPYYAKQPADRFVHEECTRRLLRKPFVLAPGDVVTIRLPQFPCHVGILSDMNGLGIIHAYAGGRGIVTEHCLDTAWKQRIVGVFTIPGVE